MTDTNDTIPEIGENPTDADQAVTADRHAGRRARGRREPPAPERVRELPGDPRRSAAPDHRQRQQRVVAQPAEPQDPREEPRRREPARRGLRLQGGVRGARPRRGQGRHRRDAHHVAGLVAGGLRQLRPAHDPHGLAQRGHLPRHRRSRRRRRRSAALRTAEQLARQRQPRQGAPPAVAGQEEVRPVALVGRPHDPRRQRRARVDGLQDVRLRRWPPRRVGAGRRRVLGPRDHVARTTSATRATASSRSRSPPCRWASSTSTPRARTATPTRWRRPATSARPSAAWR